MKRIFLKRILPMALCLLMVFPMFVFNISADSLTGTPGDKSIIGTERKNWAPDGQTYHTSVWNYDSHSKYINNGTYNHSYQFWRPSDPSRGNGNGVDPTKQNFGISYDNGYYLVDEVIVYAEPYSKGYNNIKYTVDALILGEWVTVGVGYQDDGVAATDEDGDVIGSATVKDTPLTKVVIKLEHPDGNVIYQCSACGTVVENGTDACSACGASSDSIEKKADINTNNIRISCTEYGSYAKRTAGECNVSECKELGYHAVGKCSLAPTSHDWWLVPIIQEVEIMGVTGYRPEFDVPMNAYLVTNAALSGMLGATSSGTMYHPANAGDDDKGSYWRALRPGTAQDVWAEFDQAYTVDNVGINVGGCAGNDVGVTMTYNIKVLVDGTIEDGTWEYIVKDQTVTTVKEQADYVIFDLDSPMTIKGMMVEITSVSDRSRAVMTELWAEITDGGKCIYLADYITTAKKTSTATGNLACYGEAYASSNFSYASVSRPANIIDGNVSYDDEAWIAANYLLDTYVGVTLRETHDVSKVVLYFSDRLGGTNGEYIFKYDLQAKVNGEFVTIASATSYDAEKQSYVVSIVLDEAVTTDDLRIVFKSDAQTFPYLKEFEIFEDGFMYSSYDGYPLDTSRTKGGPEATTQFADRTVMSRGKYFSEQSPLSYFNIALEHDVEIDWLG